MTQSWYARILQTIIISLLIHFHQYAVAAGLCYFGLRCGMDRIKEECSENSTS